MEHRFVSTDDQAIEKSPALMFIFGSAVSTK